MPRVARRNAPGAIAHVVTRFVNGAYVMDDVAGARHEYLHRLDAAMCRSDWRVLWYCLMSNHVHLGLVCGDDPLERWTRPLHGGFAAWINRRRRALRPASRGPVIADRPSLILVPDSRAAYLAAYIHNNPVRAGLVERANESGWSSHRVLTAADGLGALPCMDVPRAMSLCGHDPTPAGRAAFDAWVQACRREPRNAELSGLTMPIARAAMRERRGTPTEVATASLTEEGLAEYPVRLGSGDTRIAATAPIGALLVQVSLLHCVHPAALRSRSRRADLVRARRIAVLACREAHRPLIEVCRELGISDSAASYFIRTADAADSEAARAVVARLALAS